MMTPSQPLFDLRNFHDNIPRQLRLTAQAMRGLDLLVGLIRRRRREVAPSFDDFDSASPTRSVAAAHLTDLDSQFSGDREERLTRGKFARLVFISERNAGHGRRIVSNYSTARWAM